MHPEHLQADGEWTLVQRGRRRRAPRDPYYPPPLMDSSAWAAPAPEWRFQPLDRRHERFWTPRYPSPRRWEERARPVWDWSPYGPTGPHHEVRPEAYRPAYSPPRRAAWGPPHRRAPETRRAPRRPARAPGPPAGPPRPRPQVRPPPPRPDLRPRDQPRPPRHPGPPVVSPARAASARPPQPREAQHAPTAPRSDDPDFSLKNRLILAALKASHHLANSEGPEPLPIIARLTELLRVSIRPAVPNAATAQLGTHIHAGAQIPLQGRGG